MSKIGAQVPPGIRDVVHEVVTTRLAREQHALQATGHRAKKPTAAEVKHLVDAASTELFATLQRSGLSTWVEPAVVLIAGNIVAHMRDATMPKVTQRALEDVAQSHRLLAHVTRGVGWETD